MILGILWLYWIGSVLAIIFGHIAIHQIRRSGDGGRGMAIAGMVLGYVEMAVLVAVITAAVVISAA